MNVVIAAGGTGGHVFPGIAIADALKSRAPDTRILFIGTSKGLERTAVPKAGYPLHMIRTGGLKGVSLAKKLQVLFYLPLALFSCIRILYTQKTDVFISIGGYVSGPAVVAAWLLRIPFAICEPNSVPGFTNKVAGYFAKRIFGAFELTRQYFPKKRFVLSGNPLRLAFSRQRWERPDTAAPLQILVLGGSMGARPLNEGVPGLLLKLKAKGVEVKVIHQSGKADVGTTTIRYERFGLQAQVMPFIDDVAESMLAADLLICRSGATTCAEITALGVPALLVPFPYAIYDHQTINAQELAKQGAAKWIPQAELTSPKMATELELLLRDKHQRSSIAQAAYALGHKDAALQIADAALNRFI